MYSTCIFCRARLGTNEVVEAFPVGRRVAFDPKKGRLWALCTRCRQWNLSPLETRWEALESLERLYRDIPKRYSTGEIGLARHDEGLELVRIGNPARPEYAAWRYGGELVRRRRQAMLVGTAVWGGAAVMSGATLLAAGMLMGLAALPFHLAGFRSASRVVARIEGSEDELMVLQAAHVAQARLAMDEDFTWRLEFPYRVERPEQKRTSWPPQLRRGTSRDPVATLKGGAAVAAAARILPALNRRGASRTQVDAAAAFVESAGSVDHAFRTAWQTRRSGWGSRFSSSTFQSLPAPVRLGLEMVTQEDSERRALEGELARLEAEWREAETVAAIADDLLLPPRIRRLFER